MRHKRKPKTVRTLTQAPREQLISEIMKTLTRGKVRRQVAWVLEVNEAAQEFRIGEAEGMPQFIRRIGAAFRAGCPHAFETDDPRCLRCGEPNEGFIPPAGTADETLPESSEVH